MEPIPTTAKPRLLSLFLFQNILEYGIVWYTVSWYFSQGVGDGANSNDSKKTSSSLLIFFYGSWSMVWFGTRPLSISSQGVGDEPIPTTAKPRLLYLYFFYGSWSMVWFGARSLSTSSQGGGEGANSNDCKTSSSLLILFLWFLEYGMVWCTVS